MIEKGVSEMFAVKVEWQDGVVTYEHFTAKESSAKNKAGRYGGGVDRVSVVRVRVTVEEVEG